MILTPQPVYDVAIFILAGLEHQANNPFSGSRVFHWRGCREPVVKITGHAHLSGLWSENREHYFLFFQRRKPFRNRLHWWLQIDLSRSAPIWRFGSERGFDSFNGNASTARSRHFVLMAQTCFFHFIALILAT